MLHPGYFEPWVISQGCNPRVYYKKNLGNTSGGIRQSSDTPWPRLDGLAIVRDPEVAKECVKRKATHFGGSLMSVLGSSSFSGSMKKMPLAQMLPSLLLSFGWFVALIVGA